IEFKFVDDDVATDEEFFAQANEPLSSFDITIGHLEDIVVGSEFQDIQHNFLNEHYNSFEDTDENKLCYTEIHKKYMDTVETFLEGELKKNIPDFSMADFVAEVW
ncbi:unnamed protein product, partial [Protopolystoma xenopodis]